MAEDRTVGLARKLIERADELLGEKSAVPEPEQWEAQASASVTPPSEATHPRMREAVIELQRLRDAALRPSAAGDLQSSDREHAREHARRLRATRIAFEEDLGGTPVERDFARWMEEIPAPELLAVATSQPEVALNLYEQHLRDLQRTALASLSEAGLSEAAAAMARKYRIDVPAPSTTPLSLQEEQDQAPEGRS